MKKLSNNQLILIWFILLVIFPVFLARGTDSSLVRISSTAVLLGLLPTAFILWSVWGTKEKFLLKPEYFENKYGKKALNRFIFSLRLVGVSVGLITLIWTTIPTYKGIFGYYILNKPVSVIEGKIGDVETGLFDPLGLVNQSIRLDTEETISYSLWYPSLQIHVAKTYRLSVLPDTNVVLDIKKIE